MISIDEPQFRWMREHGTLHIPDVRAQNDFPMLGSAGNFRTFLAVPLRQQGELIGLLVARRTEVRPFTPAQIKLLETFADQAVIAIENVRLFQELKRSHWSSRRRRVKSWVSLPARRRTFSRCWTLWLKMQHEFVERLIRVFGCCLKVHCFERWLPMDRSREARLGLRHLWIVTQ